MTTMKISLPDELKQFVNERVNNRGFGTSSEYVRDLLRREQDRQQLRQLVLDGIVSERGRVAVAGYFASLRKKIGQQIRPRIGSERLLFGSSRQPSLTRVDDSARRAKQRPM